MKESLPNVCDHIQMMPAYEPVTPAEVLARRLGFASKDIIKLDANENPYAPVEAVRHALAQTHNLNRYPDPQQRALREALSQYHALPVENILAGAGADELIDLLMRLFLQPGDAVVNCPPTFGMYAFDANLQGARVVDVYRRPDFSLDLPALEAVVEKECPKLLFLASPNNPDGSLLPCAELERLLALPVVVVLDEAYVEFAAPGCTMINEVPRRSNLVVLRTFSKWAGLAGLRVGYGVFPAWMMEHLWKMKQPYNLSVAGSVAAVVSIEHADALCCFASRIVAERERFYKEVQKVPWLFPFPSQANFILCHVKGRDARTVRQRLAERGILVRYFDKPRLENSIRISIGTPDQMDALLAALLEMN
ncbi:MAG: histidinol-phosphate transaminase [Anaerolineae bacterium]|nr:histidinol-phosphate transaminase [Anaerolineae bacterium]